MVCKCHIIFVNTNVSLSWVLRVPHLQYVSFLFDNSYNLTHRTSILEAAFFRYNYSDLSKSDIVQYVKAYWL